MWSCRTADVEVAAVEAEATVVVVVATVVAVDVAMDDLAPGNKQIANI